MYTIFLRNGSSFGFTDMYLEEKEVDFWYKHFKRCGYTNDEILILDLDKEFENNNNHLSYFKGMLAKEV